MSNHSEEFTLVEETTVAVNITEPAGLKDETYYWADNVTFSVSSCSLIQSELQRPDVVYRATPG